MYGSQLNISDALFISAFSISVVFIILFLISTITDIVAFYKKKKNVKQKTLPINKENNIVNKSNTIDSATVAAIAGAISCMSGISSDKFIIKSIKRIPKWK